ncbi:hypothetical protein AMC83_PE00299 (plasmid) [Rhizobium phaseoli]|uniref:hypothetical protein n=1 Tax=Rhizobium phaseoli TaxID=396 RepID=UPI0007F08901|nr:hypothetical protein [Rhizobium phaseoli]ANL75712.1 hypothetical protein AMC83_PE00299 [Rhizobium phaseoli]
MLPPNWSAVMYLQYLLTLDDDGIDLVTNVVQDWCKVHHVSLECKLGREAMRFAVGRTLAGEKSPLALSRQLQRTCIWKVSGTRVDAPIS